MVPRPNLGGDSIFSSPGPLDRGVLPLSFKEKAAALTPTCRSRPWKGAHQHIDLSKSMARST